jgi:sugar O-acyltransferase (sialic acid O-acetyltransferase NeuD family)
VSSVTCVIVGAGAQGRVVLENWRAARSAARFVFVDDDPRLQGTRIMDAEVVGGLDALDALGGEVVLAVGNNRTRLALAARLSGKVEWAKVVHPSAVVMPTASIGAGSVGFAGALGNTAANVGEHVIVNTGVIVEHDAVIASGASLSPGVRTGGRVEVGEGAFLSTGVTLAARAKVGAWSVVGAGAVVVKEIPPNTLAYGVPARVVSALDAAFDWSRVL